MKSLMVYFLLLLFIAQAYSSNESFVMKLWSKSSIGNINEISIFDKYVYIFSQSGILYKLNIKDGSILELKNYFNSQETQLVASEHSKYIRLYYNIIVSLKIDLANNDMEIISSLDLTTITNIKISDEKINYFNSSIESKSSKGFNILFTTNKQISLISNKELKASFNIEKGQIIESSFKNKDIYCIIQEGKNYSLLKYSFYAKDSQFVKVEEESLDENYMENQKYKEKFNSSVGNDLKLKENGFTLEYDDGSIEYIRNQHIKNNHKDYPWVIDISDSEIIYSTAFSVPSESIKLEHELINHYQFLKNGISPQFITKTITNLVNSVHLMIDNIRKMINGDKSTKVLLDSYLIIQNKNYEIKFFEAQTGRNVMKL